MRNGHLESGIIVTAIVALCVTVIAFARARDESDATARPPSRVTLMADFATQAQAGQWIGPEDATVVILEFADFQCRGCRAFTQGAIRGVRANYPKDVAIVFRHWPLPYHEHAYEAARAAECAAVEGRFTAFHDRAYEYQDSLGTVSMARIAAEAGVVDMPRFELCTSDTARVPSVEAGILAARAVQASGVPTIAINCKLLPNVPDSAALDLMVRNALGRDNRTD